jgi:hypothetical protein
LGVIALLEQTMDTTDWELEPRARYSFASKFTSGGLASLRFAANFSRHVDDE